jgi:hypothetical protein
MNAFTTLLDETSVSTPNTDYMANGALDTFTPPSKFGATKRVVRRGSAKKI